MALNQVTNNDAHKVPGINHLADEDGVVGILTALHRTVGVEGVEATTRAFASDCVIQAPAEVPATILVITMYTEGFRQT